MNSVNNGEPWGSSVSPMDQIVNDLLQRPTILAHQRGFGAHLLNTSARLGLKSVDKQLFKEYLQNHVQPQIKQEFGSSSKLPVLMLDMGSWKKRPAYKGQFVARFFYRTRKMTWEIFEGHHNNKFKIEISWDDIVEIRADFKKYGVGMLQLKLRDSSTTPLFYKETAQKARQHIVEVDSAVFTGGKAISSRIHTLWFLQGDLDKHFAKLLRHEPRFVNLSRCAFLGPGCPGFNPLPIHIGRNVSYSCNQNTSRITVGQNSNLENYFGPTHHEQRDKGKRCISYSGGLADVVLESALNTALNDCSMVPNVMLNTAESNTLTSPYEFPYFIDPSNGGGLECADFPASNKELMIQGRFPSPIYSPSHRNYNGNGASIYWDGNELPKNPTQDLHDQSVSYQHHQPQVQQIHQYQPTPNEESEFIERIITKRCQQETQKLFTAENSIRLSNSVARRSEHGPVNC